MKPSTLDEYAIHQTPQSFSQSVSGDRNFYDRNYFNAHDRSGDLFVVSGFGIYPNLGVKDAFVTARRGDTQWAVRFSDAFDGPGLKSAVGDYRLEVLDPLHRIRLVCDAADRGIGLDMIWEGSFEPVLEGHHTLLAGPRPILDATRFAQVGTWTGTVHIGGVDFEVDPQTWLGTRDRSWGIRPVGESEPAGRTELATPSGHWWTYVPLRFDDYMLMVIVQENAEGHRTLNHATRVFADGRVEQLGWPRIEIDYRSGTRHPEAARIHLATREGTPLTVEIETLTAVSLTVGAGYGGDPDWTHGVWKGRNWTGAEVYDLSAPEITARLPYSTVDHVARATCAGQVGWGMFEHANIGRHDPSGFADYTAMAQ